MAAQPNQETLDALTSANAQAAATAIASAGASGGDVTATAAALAQAAATSSGNGGGAQAVATAVATAAIKDSGATAQVLAQAFTQVSLAVGLPLQQDSCCQLFLLNQCPPCQ